MRLREASDQLEVLFDPAVIRFDERPSIPKGIVIPSRLGDAYRIRNQKPCGSWGER